GSVDDGKSTLIGRLLWDTTDLYDDQRAQIAGESAGGVAATPDFSRLLDGLLAEREQGITIDIAWRYFDTPARRIVVIDSPGHEQYTRNMASGASHADVAIVLVDARHGIKPQTRRHAAILELMGVRRVVLAVNKMDLAAYDAARFQSIADEFGELAVRLGFAHHLAIPVVATTGENVARRSQNMEWYSGPILAESLDAAEARHANLTHSFRMPVQIVLRDGADFRGLAGSITAGRVRVGDEIVSVVSGRSAHVTRLATFDGDLESAETGMAIVIGLDRDLDIARGDVLAIEPPPAADEIVARLVWLSETPFHREARYLIRTASDLVTLEHAEVTGRIDLHTLDVGPSAGANVNDIVVARLSLSRPAALEQFASARDTGSFLLIDGLSGATLAAGVAITASRRAVAEVRRPTSHRTTYLLTREALARGLCRDLGQGPADQAEFERRTEELVRILEAAGIVVERPGGC
ncbi:MAG: GTP-binding protein, partial [Hyphomicrobiaceae bacterium]